MEVRKPSKHLPAVPQRQIVAPPAKAGYNPQPVQLQEKTSRMKRYRIRAELRILKRQAQRERVPLRELIARKLGLVKSVEDMVPLVVAQIAPESIDDQMVDKISERVGDQIVRRMALAKTDPRALAQELARLLGSKPGQSALPPVIDAQPAAERISVDDIQGMLDQLLKKGG